jgi:hypothetical protein
MGTDVNGAKVRMGTIETQQRAIQRQGTYQRDVQLPMQTAMQYIAHPLTGYMDPRQFPSAQKLAGTPAGPAGQGEYAQAYSKYADIALPAQKEITTEITKGKTLLEQYVPKELLTTIGDMGKQIQGMQLDVEQKQLNIQVAEYNNEIRMTNRSLGDAKDMYAAIQGNVKDTLGGLEGQNIALGRQSQLLGFELQQRQINFQVAMAGFAAPGTTPEERAARIAQAKIEADYAQKQLDIQKQMASNQYKVTGIGAGRAVTDLTYQLDLLTKSRAITIDTTAEQKAIQALQNNQDILIQKAQSFMDEANQVAGVYMQAITDYETLAGKAIGKVGMDMAQVFQGAGQAFAMAVNWTLDPSHYGKPAPDFVAGSIASQPTGGEGHTLANNGGKAPGFLGTVATPTTMTVGEAGTETIAVLRNPRTMTVGAGGGGGGGGGAPISFTFINNAPVRNDGDLYELKKTILNVLSEKFAMQGMRGSLLS